MSTGRPKDQIFPVFIFLAMMLTFPVTGLSSWGKEVGRANEADVARLAQDWTRLRLAETRLKTINANALMQERQRQLLGISSDASVSPADLVEQSYHYWVEKVLGPAQLITTNPAASCEEAMQAVAMVLAMMRQRALLGLEGDETRDAEIMKYFQATGGLMLLRCREEALDECTATGRIAQIFLQALGESRQAGLSGGLFAELLDDVETWAKDALAQCAIYELQFNSNTRLGPIPFVQIVRDRPIRIKFDPTAGSLLEAVEQDGLGKFLKGQTEGTSDLIFTTIKCGMPIPPPASLSCQPEMKSDPIKARITKLDLSHREYTIENGVPKVIPEVGKDEFTFELSGGYVALKAVVQVPGQAEYSIPTDLFSYAFYIAHQKDQIGKAKGQETLRIQRNKRGVYPVMFQFMYEDHTSLGPGTTAADTTEFRLIHKPEPKPFRQRDPEPIRKPLRPRPGE